MITPTYIILDVGKNQTTSNQAFLRRAIVQQWHGPGASNRWRAGMHALHRKEHEAVNYTYLLKCSDNTLYCGWTNCLDKRILAHNQGRGAKYTKSRRPVELFYYEEFATKEEAMRREWEMKKMSRRQKLMLGAGGMVRLAAVQDLQELKEMYQRIVKDMNDNGIQIWDEIYPCEFLEEDIEKNQLYVFSNGSEMLAAFALCDQSAGEEAIKWMDREGKAFYLERLGVNPEHGKKGIGSQMVRKAKEIARAHGGSCLRLFVADTNRPAVQLYIKNGFVKAEGVYDEVFEDGFVLHEYGYEIEL